MLGCATQIVLSLPSLQPSTSPTTTLTPNSSSSQGHFNPVTQTHYLQRHLFPSRFSVFTKLTKATHRIMFKFTFSLCSNLFLLSITLATLGFRKRGELKEWKHRETSTARVDCVSLKEATKPRGAWPGCADERTLWHLS